MEGRAEKSGKLSFENRGDSLLKLLRLTDSISFVELYPRNMRNKVSV